MKNWKYIEGAKTGNIKDDAKTGNQKVDNTWTPEQALKYYEDAKKANDQNKMAEIKEIIRQEKNGAYKYYQELQSRKDDIIHNNSGYGKVAYYNDAKKKFEAWQNVASKVGNIAADITTDGNTWFVTTSDGKKKEFATEREAEAYVKKIKTGNDTPLEYARRKPRVINEEKTGAEEFFKKLSDDVKEREEKDDADIEKVGNASVSGGTFKSDDGSQKAVIDINPQSGTARVVWFENDRQNGSSDYRSIDLATAAVKRKGLKKVGNATPNYRYKDFLITNPEGHEYIVFLKDGRTVGYRGTTSKAQAEDWCDWHDPKTGKSIGNKTGNKKLKFTDKQDGLKEFVYDEENDKGYIYYDGKLVDTIPHAGQGWLNLIKQKAFSSGVMNKVGNSKTGNATYTEADRKRLYELAKKRNKTAQEWAEFDELNRREEQASRELIKKIGKPKTGNSASDDKFAYVMREFDEGKLKTPDGKVVTDPAQAKAIAYSESKKTENGLARARKAIK